MASKLIITGAGYIGPAAGYIPPGPTTYSVAGGTGTGTQVTLNFASTLSSAPYSAGQYVLVSGLTPASADGTFQVVSSNTTSVIIINTTSGSITGPGTVVLTSAPAPSVTGTFVAVAGIVSLSNVAATSVDGVNWTQQTLSTSQQWRSVAYGNNTFVAVATGPTANTTISSYGNSWTQGTLSSAGQWNSIGYGGGVFVTVRGGPSNVVATSSDGTTWTQRTLPSSQNWYSPTYGAGTWVAVAANGTIGITAYSTDNGATWAQTSLTGFIGGLTSVAYGNGIFVAVIGTTNTATSPDGITWTLRSAVLPISASAIAYGANTFVAITSATATAATSPDGVTWTSRTLPVSTTWQSITFGNGIFVIVAGLSAASTVAATSIDGFAWTQRTLPASVQWSSVICSTYTPPANQGIIVSVASQQYPGNLLVARSTTGGPIQASYTTIAGVPSYWSAVNWNGNQFLAVSHTTSTTATFATSPDGAAWTARTFTVPSGTRRYGGIAYGGGTYVVLSGEKTTGDGNVAVSTDQGVTWTNYNALPNNFLWIKIAYGAGVFVTIPGSIGFVPAITTANTYISSNGVSWTTNLNVLPFLAFWTGLAYGNNVFLAVGGANGNALSATSIDGVTWANTGNTIIGTSGVAYGNGIFVAFNGSNSNNITATSDNGATWTMGPGPGPVNYSWTGIGWGPITNKWVLTSGYISTAQGNAIAVASDPLSNVWYTANTVWSSGNGVIAANTWSAPAVT